MSEREAVKWIGAPVPRREDLPLTTGAGKYMDDIDLPGMLHMVVLRSPHAHARVVSIDSSAALSHPGVRAVFTAKDLEGIVQPLPVLWSPQGTKPFAIRAMASEKVRYVGEPVAILIAESPHVAEDA